MKLRWYAGAGTTPARVRSPGRRALGPVDLESAAATIVTSVVKMPRTSMSPLPQKNREALTGVSPQLVNRRILTFRMRPKAASVAIIDEPP